MNLVRSAGLAALVFAVVCVAGFFQPLTGSFLLIVLVALVAAALTYFATRPRGST